MPSSPQVERPCKTIAMAGPVSIRNCRRSMWGFSQFSVARPGISKRNEQVRSFPERDSRLSEAYGVAFIRAPRCRHMDTAGEGISGASFGPARRGGFPLRAAEVVEAFRGMPLGFYPGWLLCDIQTRPAAAESAGEQASRPALRSGRLYPARRHFGADHRHDDLYNLDLAAAENGLSYLAFFCFFSRGEAAVNTFTPKGASPASSRRRVRSCGSPRARSIPWTG